MKHLVVIDQNESASWLWFNFNKNFQWAVCFPFYFRCLISKSIQHPITKVSNDLTHVETRNHQDYFAIIQNLIAMIEQQKTKSLYYFALLVTSDLVPAQSHFVKGLLLTTCFNQNILKKNMQSFPEQRIIFIFLFVARAKTHFMGTLHCILVCLRNMLIFCVC